MFEKVSGHCQIRDCNVEILFIAMNKGKSKAGTKTPVRCQNSGECPKGIFCKFVNPLTTRIPVDLDSGTTKPAEAS